MGTNCVQCGRKGTVYIDWSGDYKKWFCDSHAPTIWGMVNKFLTSKQKKFQKWLSEQLNN